MRLTGMFFNQVNNPNIAMFLPGAAYTRLLRKMGVRCLMYLATVMVVLSNLIIVFYTNIYTIIGFYGIVQGKHSHCIYVLKVLKCVSNIYIIYMGFSLIYLECNNSQWMHGNCATC